jgi:hypothetical protein
MTARKTGFLVLLVVGLLCVIGMHFYNQHYHEDVKSRKKMYCYQTFWGPPNSALIVKDLDYGRKLIDYYKLVEKGDNPPIEFPLLGLPTDTPVYIMGYAGSDSLLVDIVNYWDKGGKSRGNYLRGYVYAGTLHEVPPPAKKQK